MGRNGALAVFGFFIATGCASTGLLYDESEALRAASSPAGAGFLGLLPAKKEGPRDPGEVLEGELRLRWGMYGGLFFPQIGDTGVNYQVSWLVRGFARLGADRANPIGLELSFGQASLEGRSVDSTAREFFFRGRGLFNVGPHYFYLTAGMQLVYEEVEWAGESLEGHLGATLDLGVNRRFGEHFEFDQTFSLLLGSENSAVTVDIMLGVVF